MASIRKPVVIVTGASRGIGLAVTRLLLKKFNAQVVALSRSQSSELVALTSSDLLIVPCDVSDEASLNNAVAQAKLTYGHIDALVLNAGILEPLGNIGGDPSISAWKEHFDVNFFSLVTALKAALPALRKSDLGGKVIFVSSGAAVKGSAGWGPYSAGKAAMNSLCRTMAEEEPTIVSVALRPGMVDTNMQTTLRNQGGSVLAEKDHEKFVKAHSEGKLVRPEDAGHVIAALALRAQPALSGQFVSWDSEEYNLDKAALNRDLGWKAPAGTLPWSPEASIQAMDASGISMAILSLPPLYKGSVPNETFKAAAHLVVTGSKRKYYNVKIILAHLGGTTPTLAPRVAVLSTHMGCSLTHDEILDDFRSFYYETALSSYGPNLACIEKFVPMEKILFGTDFPAVSVDMAQWYTENLKDHYKADDKKLEMVLSSNALNLFPSLQDRTN
ncbi:hypothetical protein H0H92_004065 [Tricholoma furcatifolium]|nr:hypothetical protein H0H92_004065 [Tricholoma furcatifolium]